MSLLNGKSENEVRILVSGLAARRRMPLDKFFVAAAAEHAPDLPHRSLERKLKRFEGGGAAPCFVKEYVHHLLDAERREASHARY